MKSTASETKVGAWLRFFFWILLYFYLSDISTGLNSTYAWRDVATRLEKNKLAPNKGSKQHFAKETKNKTELKV